MSPSKSLGLVVGSFVNDCNFLPKDSLGPSFAKASTIPFNPKELKLPDSTLILLEKVSFSGLDKLYLSTIVFPSIAALSPKFPANLLTFSKYPPLASFEAALNPWAASTFPCKAIRGFFTSASLASVVLFKFTIFS